MESSKRPMSGPWLAAFIASTGVFGLGTTPARAADAAGTANAANAANVTAPSPYDAEQLSHLKLARAYVAQGRYAEAKIEFETVLRLDNLPPDLLTQVEAYDQAARQALEEGSPLTHFAYLETGLGYFRINDTVATSSGERSESFVNFRTGGGFNYQLDNGWAIDGSLDWRFRSYDDSASRNDGDVRWNLAGAHALGDDGNLAIGLRGRNSYRGNGDYRNDAGIYADYRRRMDAEDQLSFGGEVLRREYPQGGLRDRSRSSASVSAGWVHSLFEGKGSFSVTGHVGQHFATNRPDGNSDFYGATVSFDYTVAKTVGWGAFAWWEHDAYNIDRIHFHPDALANAVLLRRNDNLYEVGAYVVWEFAPTWTLRPELLWIRDQSNSFNVNYGSTEAWLNVRKAF
jgi:hypothetical protein